MIQTTGFTQFCDAFSEDRRGTFTFEGKRALFDYLEEYEESTGESIELDIVALCCEYTEYDNMEDLQASYPDIKTMEELQDHTQVILIEGTEGFIIADY